MKNHSKLINIAGFFVWIFITIILTLPFFSNFKIIPLFYLPEDIQAYVLAVWLIWGLGYIVWFSENRIRFKDNHK